MTYIIYVVNKMIYIEYHRREKSSKEVLADDMSLTLLPPNYSI